MPRGTNIRFSVTPFYYARQFYYALEQGIVEGDGVDVAIEFRHSPAKDHAITCGAVDATTMSLGKYVLARAVGHLDLFPVDPLAVGVGLCYEQGSGLFAAAGSAIRDPADVEGARIGIHDRSAAMTYHKAILENLYGIDLDTVTWVVDTHQKLTTAFEEGEVDVVERVGDWYWSYLEDPSSILLYDLAEAWKALEGDYPIVHLLVVDEALQADRPSAVDSFLDGVAASRKYRNENYEEVLEAFVAEPEPASEWTGERTVDALRRITDTAMLPVTLDETKKENVRSWMAYAVEYGVMEKPLSGEELFP